MFCANYFAQNFSDFSVSNAHSHNDYKQPVPFYTAYFAGFGSIEADVFYSSGAFLVGHEESELKAGRTLENLYLSPLSEQVKINNGTVYGKKGKSITLFIEMKSDYKAGLPALAKLLANYQDLSEQAGVQFIITGHVPPPSEFKNYPQNLRYDGDLNINYTPEQLKQVGMFSSDLALYTSWHGKGIMRDEESAKVKTAVEKAHRLGKKIRFWNAPDFPNAWVNLIGTGVDYINTDHIPELAGFLKSIPKNFYKNDLLFNAYKPKYLNDGKASRVKNIILMIPDGVSLPQYYAAYTANRGNLNIFRMRYTALSNTNSANAYITDSAPGSTAFATGVKTKNNYVGVDAAGNKLKQIPEILAERKMVSGLITTGDVTDATPADFYAHNSHRDESGDILKDFATSAVSVLAGGPADGLSTAEPLLKSNNISLFQTVSQADFSKSRLLITDPAATKNYSERGKWLGQTFDKTINKLKQNKDGFFLMVEASRTDINAHANDFPAMVKELLDFDETVGKAMKFADEDGETLVVVLGDHETGGLTILDGSIKDGWVLGSYNTNDHTPLPAAVFAYGPQAQSFTGFFENTEIFNKILKALTP